MIGNALLHYSGDEACWREGHCVEDAASLLFLREYQRSMLSVILVNSKGAAFMNAVTV